MRTLVAHERTSVWSPAIVSASLRLVFELAIAVAFACDALWQAYSTHRRQMRGAAQLRGLTDHELKDIGLTRGNIEAAARGIDPRR